MLLVMHGQTDTQLRERACVPFKYALGSLNGVQACEVHGNSVNTYCSRHVASAVAC